MLQDITATSEHKVLLEPKDHRFAYLSECAATIGCMRILRSGLKIPPATIVKRLGDNTE